MLTITLLMIAHVIQWLIMGRTVSPIEPSEAMYTLQNGAVNAGFIFFSLAILATLILGRFVCGWMCHVVALQDLCAWILKKFGLKPRPFRSRLLVYVPLIVALYMFVWPTVYRWMIKPPNEPLIPEFTNHLITTEFWATFPPIAVAIPFLFICGFVTVYFLGSKGFCTYGCPYGGFFGVADKVAPGRIRVTDACNECGHCTATCTSNVLVHAEVKEHGMVVDPGCMKCMDCVSVCPNDALYFGFGKPAVGVDEQVPRRFSLTWPEEIGAAAVFVLSYFAVWDVYQLVPMLMALGIACVTTFVVMKSWKLIRSENQSFYKHLLKSSGRVKTAGWIFLGFAFLWTGLNVHSGWVRYHEYVGTRAYESIGIPDELALAQRDPRRWLTEKNVESLKTGRENLEFARNIGLFTNSFALPKLGWMEFLAGDAERAIQTLDTAAANQSGRDEALSLYYRGAILNRMGRHGESLEGLQQALAVAPELVLAYEEKGVSLWKLGKKEEAIESWKKALEGNPRLPLSSYFLSGAFESLNTNGEALAYERRAAQLTPRDPFFLTMLSLRLKDAGMDRLAKKQLEAAKRLRAR